MNPFFVMAGTSPGMTSLAKKPCFIGGFLSQTLRTIKRNQPPSLPVTAAKGSNQGGDARYAPTRSFNSSNWPGR